VTIRPKLARPHPFWRIVLLVLVVLPLLPEIAVLNVSAIAELSGCRVDAPPLDSTIDSQIPPDPSTTARGFAPPSGSTVSSPGEICTIGPAVSSIIRLALNAGFFVGDTFGSGVVIIWLALCYVSISRGWRSFLSRLTLAFLVSLIFAIIPYLGPMISVAHLENPRCQPNDAGIGPCTMYGGEVGSIVHYNVALALDDIQVGAAVALVAFSLYAVFLLIAGLAAWVSARLWHKSKNWRSKRRSHLSRRSI
jgi:hypothetical protein